MSISGNLDEFEDVINELEDCEIDPDNLLDGTVVVDNTTNEKYVINNLDDLEDFKYTYRKRLLSCNLGRVV